MSYKPKYPCVVCGTPAADGHTNDCVYTQQEKLIEELQDVLSGVTLVKVAKLAIGGLHIDGSHHKQWYLEQILEVLGVKDISDEPVKKGIAP